MLGWQRGEHWNKKYGLWMTYWMFSDKTVELKCLRS